MHFDLTDMAGTMTPRMADKVAHWAKDSQFVPLIFFTTISSLGIWCRCALSPSALNIWNAATCAMWASRYALCSRYSYIHTQLSTIVLRLGTGLLFGNAPLSLLLQLLVTAVDVWNYAGLSPLVRGAPHLTYKWI